MCTACGFILWQNVKPSVEALIVRGEGAETEVLLGRRIADLPQVRWDGNHGLRRFHGLVGADFVDDGRWKMDGMPNADLVFCPRCAERLEWRGVEYPDVLHPVCAACGFILWQNVKPSVEALIIRGEGTRAEVLLGRRIADLPQVRWDIPGGFLNAGDKIEAALIRECKREMSIDVTVGDLVGAYEGMFFDIPMVSLIYACQIVGGDPTPHDYIDEIRWFPLSDPPKLAFAMIGDALTALRRRHYTSASADS